MPKNYDLIAFDWDGTLFDSTAVIVQSIQSAVVDMGCAKPSAEQAAWVIGLGLEDALAKSAPDLHPDQYREAGLRYREHYLKHHDDITLFPGVLSLLRELKAEHHWLAVATGKTRMGLNRCLQDPQLQNCFDATRTADETANKPNPTMLFELMREFGVAPERTLMIGDTTHDLQMAQNAACASVGVSYGAHGQGELALAAPRFIASSVTELRQWLAQNG